MLILSLRTDIGDGTDVMPGIRPYTGREWPFTVSEDPVTFIITPRSRIDPRPGNYHYDSEVTRIKAKLLELIPGAMPRIFDYEVSDNTCTNHSSLLK